ncbi:glycine zipper domain-containing protein [Neisseria sp.]|uniref:glycine zipper domain-containing protein n=1 Tax=Neisseria sp. TaxID=192066 RepID=UPI00289E3CEC|nr:glycine zipper domain-containing protein [Neisseria sp.]
MKIKNILLTSLVSASLIAPVSTAQARGTTDQTTATIVGAATGAIIGNAFGKNTKSTLIGATVGGLAGNAYAYRNKKAEAKERDERQYAQYHKPTHHKHKRKKHRERDWDDD